MNCTSSCWTCRVRRKRCDAAEPLCNACAMLNITCHRGPERPAWMDGGVRQQWMAARLKREVRANGPRRRERREVDHSGGRIPLSDVGGLTEPPNGVPRDLSNPTNGSFQLDADLPSNKNDPYSETQASRAQPHSGDWYSMNDECIMNSSGWPHHILLMFYLDNVFPFLFPFYRPSLLQEGGRAWILDMMLKSPALRQACLCQSSLFFFSLGTGGVNAACEAMLGYASDAFSQLRSALQMRLDEGIPELPHCTVRLMASVIQLQRFEIATLNFDNCQQHLNAAVELFQRLLNNSYELEPTTRYNAVLRSLRSSFYDMKVPSLQYSSAEQSAFRFSSALVILDDIIASVVVQEQPRLFDYHDSILGDTATIGGTLQLETIIGCQNWVFLEIGKIATLDAWKQRSKRTGSLDVIELVHRATSIRNSLQEKLLHLAISPLVLSETNHSMFEALATDLSEQPRRGSCQISVMTRIWAHAALVYLSVVVSGWQPANVEVRHNVGQVIDLLTHQLQPPALLRTVVWPFCVAGCLAERTQENQIRGLVAALQPPSVFGTVRKALEIMENVWSSRDSADSANRDLAACFRGQGDLILLV